MSAFYTIKDCIFNNDLNSIKACFKSKPILSKGQQSILISTSIQAGRAEIYTYLYHNKKFDYVEMNYSNDIRECIRYNSLNIEILEAIRYDFYGFDNAIFNYILICCEEHKPEFVRMLYFKYRDIYHKFLFPSTMSYVIQLHIHDVFLDYVQIWTDMKEIRKMCDIYQNGFVLKWLHENNKMCNVEKDPYCRVASYYRVNTHYKYLLGAYGLNYDGKKASDEIYVKYMTAMMKIVSK
jgi:hypothetical protein